MLRTLGTLGHVWKRLEGMALTTWLEKLGFTENPFYSEPVSADAQVISKGFINRKKERSSAEDFAQLSEGKLLILGSVGEGKSSLLNLLQYNAEKAGKFALRINLLNAETTEAFIEQAKTYLTKSWMTLKYRRRERKKEQRSHLHWKENWEH
jgi:ABC-type transport system involved in cytochrome bd biosynthesis fused ATPase/permease subunit